MNLFAQFSSILKFQTHSQILRFLRLSMVHFQSFISELFQRDSNIIITFFNNISQQRTQFGQTLVLRIIVPALDVHTIIWLKLEIFSIVINNYSSGELSPYSRQVLLVHVVGKISVLSV
jgi:hypothetical protein